MPWGPLENTAKHTGNVVFIYESYFQLLGRQADNAGVSYRDEQSASGITPAVMVTGFL